MSLQDDRAGDLDVFLDTDDFAVTATVAGVSVSALFDRLYGETEEIAGYRPALHCKTTDVSSVAEGDAVTVEGVSYIVAGIEEDGTGITRFVLEEAE